MRDVVRLELPARLLDDERLGERAGELVELGAHRFTSRMIV